MLLRSRLSRLHDDLNMIAMIGTSDRLCWLAETCKILLLLLCRMLRLQCMYVAHFEFTA